MNVNLYYERIIKNSNIIKKHLPGKKLPYLFEVFLDDQQKQQKQKRQQQQQESMPF